MGDSVAAGTGDPVKGYRDLSWAEQLVEALASDRDGVIPYRNLGRRGARSGEIRALQLDDALAFAPDLVALSAGGNDMLDGSFDAARVEHDIDVIVTALRRTGADVLTFSLFDLSRAPFVPEASRAWLHDGLRELASVTERVARRRGCVHVDFFRHARSGDPSIYSADRLHPNRRGHALVAEEIIQALLSHSTRGGVAGAGRAGL